jgi:general secretion pathway protein D
MGRISYRNCVDICVRNGQHGAAAEPGFTTAPGRTMKSRSALQAASGCIQTRFFQISPIFLRAGRWIALFAVAAVFGLSSVQLHAAESAASFFKHGQAAEAREDYDTALDDYQKALAKAPKDLTYRTAIYRVRTSASAAHLSKGRRLLLGGDDQAALVEFLHAAEIDPGNEAAQQEIAKARQKSGEKTLQAETSLNEQAGAQEEIDSIGPPAVLKPLSNESLTLHYTEDSKVVYEAIGKAAGINILFDPDYTSKRIQVDLNNSSLLDALRIVGTLSNTFWRPVTDNTIFVAQNNRAKRTELDEQAVQTFYLANAWQQTDLTDVQSALRNVLAGSFKAYAVAGQNAIVCRGTPDELLLAQKLINDLDKARAEVVVDIAVLEVNKNWEKTLGIAWPSSIGIALQPPNSSSSASTCAAGSTNCTSSSGTSPTLYDLAHLKATDFSVTIGSATANLLLTDSNTKILDNPRIRATDQQKALLTIGERIPVATGSYQTGAATAVVSSLVNTQFQYQDVGVKVEMTPTVHFDDDVTLKIKIEVSSVASEQNISGVTEPIIAQNIVDQVIRLREGEASILGGIQQNQDQVSWTGIPGLSSIPVLKYLFGSKDHTITDSELVFLVVPHIVRSQSIDRANLRQIDTGAGSTTIDLRHVATDGASATPTQSATPAQVPATGGTLDNLPMHRGPRAPQSNVGVVPGQSAMAAAPAALAQLSASADANGQQATAAAAAHTPNAAGAPSLPGALGPGHAKSVSLSFNPPAGPVAVGATFQVPIVVTDGADISSVAVQVKYDPAKLSLVNVSPGDYLIHDGQSASPVHSDDDGTGSVNVVAARPPGTPGVAGTGVVYSLSFQAKVAGETVLTMARGATVNSAQQQAPAQGGQISIVVK